MSSVADTVKQHPEARGLAIIISNDYADTEDLIELRGTLKDAAEMKQTFAVGKFATLCEHNVTRERLRQLLYESTRLTHYPDNYKCIAFVFSGHGCEGNQLYMQDKKRVRVESIIEPFLPKAAPKIGNIPKLFFIDACRGKETMSSITVPRGSNPGVHDVQAGQAKGGAEVTTLKLPPEGNFLVAYSTMPQHLSYELEGQGGIWMTTLAKKLRTSHASVEDILTDVNEELIEKYQLPDQGKYMMQPERLSRLNRRVYLLQQDAAANYGSSSCVNEGSAIAHAQFPQSTWNGQLARWEHIRVKPTLRRNKPSIAAVFSGTVAEKIVMPLVAPSQDQSTQLSSSGTHSTTDDRVTENGTDGCYEGYAELMDCEPSVDTSTVTGVSEMCHLFQQERVTPQYEYTEDGTSGQTRFKCAIKYSIGGRTERVNSGGYYPTRDEAKEQAATCVVSKESSEVFSARTAAPKPHKMKLKEYFDKKGILGVVKYSTKGCKGGFKSIAYLPGIGPVYGHVQINREGAEENAASQALKKLVM